MLESLASNFNSFKFEDFQFEVVLKLEVVRRQYSLSEKQTDVINHIENAYFLDYQVSEELVESHKMFAYAKKVLETVCLMTGNQMQTSRHTG